jgi:DNA-binding Lrp family transcriptional regulator
VVTAIVLIQVEKGKVHETAEQLSGVSGISEVYSVAGPYDLVAILRVPRNEDVQDIVTGEIQALDAVGDTETFIAFRCYSRYDLERVFSIGFEEGD